jgi:hypothetical protein
MLLRLRIQIPSPQTRQTHNFLTHQRTETEKNHEKPAVGKSLKNGNAADFEPKEVQLSTATLISSLLKGILSKLMSRGLTHSSWVTLESPNQKSLKTMKMKAFAMHTLLNA